MPFKYKNMQERLFHNSVVNITTNCWEWVGTIASNGYGRINIRENGTHKKLLVHRISYMEFKGEIPDGHEVHHKCYNRQCINPDHLEALEPVDHHYKTDRRKA